MLRGRWRTLLPSLPDLFRKPIMRLSRPSFVALIVLVATLAGMALPLDVAAADADGEPAIMNVISQASQRLALADTVARYKWLKSQDITDLPRENALLQDVTRRAPDYGVDPQFARVFFRDQIDANKFVQQALIDDWRQIPPAPQAVPDLATGIRPELDRLTVSILIALGRIGPIRRADDCPTRLAHSLAEWQRLNLGDTLHEQALERALAHLCIKGGVGATA